MKKLPFKIGADPEYAILLQDLLVPAQSLLKTLCSDEPEGNMGFKIGSAGILGWDGASSTGEIRPSPCDTPSGLARNIKKLFKHFVDKTELFALSTLSNKAPIGGHIHFELPLDKTSNVSVSSIHKKMMAFYIPVMLGENNMNLRIRNKQNYGRLTDHRSDEHGGAMTYEFRVPSAEWLTTPKITEATLAYLSCVYNEIINKPRNFNKHKNLTTKNDAQARALQELTLANFEALTSVICGKIRKAIKTFEYYEHYKEQIDFILSPKKIIREKEKAEYNIVSGWKLAHNNNPTKRQLMSEKQLRDRAALIDLDKLSCLITIQSNPDEYVDTFVRAIKHRIIAMNWKLRNNYFLFGLKKGIERPIVKDKANRYIVGAEQIKTKLDFRSMDSTFVRMETRFRDTKITSRNDDKKKQIMIGLPYDMRIEQDTRKIIDLVHSIERKTYTPKELNRERLEEDRNLAPTDAKAGKIFKIYSRVEISDNIASNNNPNPATEEVIQATIRAEEREEAEEIEENEAEEREAAEENNMPFKSIINDNGHKIIYSLLNKEVKLYNHCCCLQGNVPSKKGFINWIGTRRKKNLCAE